jgi:hypothetical protein
MYVKEVKLMDAGFIIERIGDINRRADFTIIASKTSKTPMKDFNLAKPGKKNNCFADIPDFLFCIKVAHACASTATLNTGFRNAAEFRISGHTTAIASIK